MPNRWCGKKYTISVCFLLFEHFLVLFLLSSSMVDWLLCFLFLWVISCQLCSALASALNSAKYIHCTLLYCPPHPPSPGNIISSPNSVLQPPCVMHISVTHSSWAWVQMDILIKCDWHVHVYICIPDNRSLIQTLALMRLAMNLALNIMIYHTPDGNMQSKDKMYDLFHTQDWAVIERYIVYRFVNMDICITIAMQMH